MNSNSLVAHLPFDLRRVAIGAAARAPKQVPRAAASAPRAVARAASASRWTRISHFLGDNLATWASGGRF